MKKIAIITGASSGIGRSFCKQYDAKNFDEIWAIALDLEGLESLQKECKTKIVPLAYDLTVTESFEDFKARLKKAKPDVQLLINCSGFGKFARYDEIKVETSANMIDLNCKATMRMTEYTLPYMSKGARIMNIASVAGWQPIPFINVYAATKAFVISYSRALNRELKPRGISVTTICPFWTKTAFFKRAKDNDAMQEVVTKYVAMYDPDFVVKKAMKATEKRKDLVVVGFKSKMQCWLVKTLPHSWIMNIWMRQQKLNKKYKDRPVNPDAGK
ncbi:MAG: SDR family NAD(P)-dependent oxidoreductase [Clostridia bacterium]|nr:SDR family NAD(P)-dependent oxidoreductase [Clostridia bacterium]